MKEKDGPKIDPKTGLVDMASFLIKLEEGERITSEERAAEIDRQRQASLTRMYGVRKSKPTPKRF